MPTICLAWVIIVVEPELTARSQCALKVIQSIRKISNKTNLNQPMVVLDIHALISAKTSHRVSAIEEFLALTLKSEMALAYVFLVVNIFVLAAGLQLVEGGNQHAWNSSVVESPEVVAEVVERSINSSLWRRELGMFSCGTGNPIDDCWRCDPHWNRNRKRLADCAIGFGKNAIGGKYGRIYVVTDDGDYDALNPRPGTLRHAVIQWEPLWIIFARDMVITLQQELIMNSYKTIDARDFNVHIAHGPCITIQNVNHIIIHGLHIHHCVPRGNTNVRSTPDHYGWRGMCDGDGISIMGGRHIWIDHCSLSRCSDGLIDAVAGSTAITISNNHFAHHNDVMLLGHSDDYRQDKKMHVTIAFNHFGKGLVQRMPRCRHGYFHVVNNDYTHWEMYAIGGSANPTINSQGNRYMAPMNPFAKE
ncbi:hypothetical protein KI387_034216, partial [Taxus chinensis]